MKLVLVVWTDSARERDGWEFVNDMDFDDMNDKLQHESVGWIIKETKEYISLAHSRAVFVYEDGDNSVIRSINISKCAIKNMHNLTGILSSHYVIKNQPPKQ